MNQAFVWLQYLLPHHFLSRAVGYLARCEIGPVKDALIKVFIRAFKVEMDDYARQRPDEFEHFNDFFTRSLKDGAREWGAEDKACSPVDGTVSETGKIEYGRIVQAKNHNYRVEDLLADEALAKKLEGGDFATLYLAPKDYHRIHMPFDGKLVSMTHVPGRLFSVNQATADGVPNLFARNERVVCEFETERGTQVLVLVGAMIVASIKTSWAGLVTPVEGPQRWNYTQTDNIELKRGDEMGQFLLGSTVIWLAEKDVVSFDVEAGDPVRLGGEIGAW